MSPTPINPPPNIRADLYVFTSAALALVAIYGLIDPAKAEYWDNVTVALIQLVSGIVLVIARRNVTVSPVDRAARRAQIDES